MSASNCLSFCNRIMLPFVSKRCRSTVATLPSPFPKQTKGPMTAHQKDLPRQPVPPLKPTLEKYVRGVKPLLTHEEFQNTEKLVSDFGSPGGIGEKLHSVLLERYNQLDNWIADWWLEMDFLRHRYPLITYANPGMAMSCQQFKSVDDQIKFSAKVLASTIAYKRIVDDHQLEPDKMRGVPMDMSQYIKAFSTCRLPRKTCDHLIHYGEDDYLPNHIIVARNNRFFRVDVFDDAGYPITEQHLLQQLRLIVMKSQVEAPPVGLLTTNYRDVWAEVYDVLCEDETNRESVETIQKAQFVFSLDKPLPKTDDSCDKWTRCLQNAIHGYGSDVNSGNRWMDKSFHLIVSEDGMFGLNMEHSPIEAHPLLRMTDYIMDDLKKASIDQGPITSRFVSEPKELIFHLNDQILDAIEKAKVNVEKCCSDADLSPMVFPGYGSQFLKSLGISTDSFIQMALQLAFYRLHGLRGVLYEVATLHSFLFGRMEIVHSTSKESIDFCKAMMSNNVSVQDKRSSLQKALKTHKHDVNEALKGNGVDTLLVGLKKAAIENGVPVHDMYSDIGFESFFNYRLVSSQAPIRNEVFPSYGPLVADGYGCPYYVYPDHLRFISLSLKQHPETDSSTFMRCVETSLWEMGNILKDES